MIASNHFGHHADPHLNLNVAWVLDLPPDPRGVTFGDLVLHHVRGDYLTFPSGTSAETFGTVYPLMDYFAGDLPIQRVLDWCAKHGKRVHLLTPSRGFINDPSQIEPFFDRLATLRNLGVVETVTIGNEFYVDQKNVGGRITPESYAWAVNATSPYVERLFPGKTWLQWVPPFRHFDNPVVIANIAPEVWRRVAGINVHHYPVRQKQVRSFPRVGRYGPIRNPRILVGEWNTQFGAAEIVGGVEQALDVIEIFHTMMLNPNVEYAAFWGLLWVNLPNRAATATATGARITATGHMLDSLYDLQGWGALPGEFLGMGEREVTFGLGEDRVTYFMAEEPRGTVALSRYALKDDPATPVNEAARRWANAAGAWETPLADLVRAGEINRLRWRTPLADAVAALMQVA